MLPSAHHSRCPWFIDAVLAQYTPGDAGQLVGQSRREHVVVQACRCGREPVPKTVLAPLGWPEQQHAGSLDQQRSQVAVAALGQAAQHGSIASGDLARHQAEPRPEVASPLESRPIADRCHHGTGNNRSHARHAHQALAGLVRRHQSSNLACHCIDAFVEMLPVLHQSLDHVRHARREHVRSLGENVGQSLPQRTQPLSHCNPALEQEGAGLVNHRRALAHQARADPVQGLQVKLLDRLGGHEAHGGAKYGLGNRFGVAEVIFVALAEGDHELRRDQLHVMAERQQLAAEMVGADAGLHADQADRHVGEARLNLPARELLAQDDGATGIQADQVEAVLADVDAKGGNVLKRSFWHGSSPRAGRPS
jgi:hypothetical protein